MTTPKMRPTFSLLTKLSATEVIVKTRQSIAASADEYHGQFSRHHGIVSIVESKRHFWSPWLQLEVREGDEGRQVFGRFSPHPSIWTGFMFAYLSLTVVAFFAIILGLSQLMTSAVPWGFWLIPACALVALALRAAAHVGQKLAWNEMANLKQFVIDCLDANESTTG